MNNLLKNTSFLAIIATWLWSTAFVGVKIGLEYHTPLQFAGIRFFISGVLILLINGKFQRFIQEVKPTSDLWSGFLSSRFLFSMRFFTAG